MNYPTHIREMLPLPAAEGQTVHPERSIVIEDRREAAKALCEVMRMNVQDWGEFSSSGGRWRTASRLIDLDWRYGSGRLTEFPK